MESVIDLPGVEAAWGMVDWRVNDPGWLARVGAVAPLSWSEQLEIMVTGLITYELSPLPWSVVIEHIPGIVDQVNVLAGHSPHSEWANAASIPPIAEMRSLLATTLDRRVIAGFCSELILANDRWAELPAPRGWLQLTDTRRATVLEDDVCVWIDRARPGATLLAISGPFNLQGMAPLPIPILGERSHTVLHRLFAPLPGRLLH